MSQQHRAAVSDHIQLPEARERISHAAFRLFGKKGYTCTSVQDIADAAEVQKSILYYYFGSKEALYQTLCSESAKNLRAFLLQALNEAGLPKGLEADGFRAELPANVSCESLLAALAETLITLARDNREPVRFFMAHVFAPDGDRPPVSTCEMEQLTPQLIRHIARAGMVRGELCGELADLERLILGAVQYSIIRHLRNPEEEPLKVGLGPRIVSAVLRGFTAMPNSAAQRRQSAAASTAPAERPDSLEE